MLLAVLELAKQKYDPRCPITKLKLHPDNPRRGDVATIAQSIEANGFYGAVIAQKSTGRILAGNHRFIAAREKTAKTLPVLWVDCDDETALRILLADNRTSDLGAYDEAQLLETLDNLVGEDGGPGALFGTGYGAEAIAELKEKLDAAAKAPDGFKEVDENIETEFTCPKCGYQCSGQSVIKQKQVPIASVD